MSSCNLVFSDYKVIGLKDGWEEHNPVYFSLLESEPLKGKPPVKVVACCFEETIKQMKLMKVRNGSRVIASAKWQTYMKNEKVMDSFKITDLSILSFPIASRTETSKPAAQKITDIECDLDSL